MSFVLIGVLIGVGLFALMMIASEVGWRIGGARLARGLDGFAKGVGPVEGATFGLFGLLIAFSFSGAAARFEDRRHLIADEANAIGTAYLRVDLLPADAQPPLRDLFRRYVDVRYVVYRDAEDTAVTEARIAESDALQAMIWALAIGTLQRPGTPASTATLLLGSLNDMFDITDTRAMATENHPPSVVFVLLAGLSILCSLLVGYSLSQNRERNWLHAIMFAAVVSLTVYVIIDLEFPRVGFIQIESADEMLGDLREEMQ